MEVKHLHPKSFLSRFIRKVAVISVGKDNRYGHPHCQVLEEVETIGVP